MAGSGIDTEILVQSLIACSLEAGRAVMEIYDGDFAVETKADSSPVTAADKIAEQIILKALDEAAPSIQVISEESADPERITATQRRFFLVDPLDGTREFIKRNGEFTINIALIEDSVPVLGVIYAPAIHRLFAASPATGAFEARIAPEETFSMARRSTISVRHQNEDEALTVVASRSHGDPALDTFLKDYTVTQRKSAGSSLKFCLVAAGEADLYPRHGRTMEWDTAAGQAILEIAGGSVTTFEGDPLRYGKLDRGLDNPGFVARGWS